MNDLSDNSRQYRPSPPTRLVALGSLRLEWPVLLMLLVVALAAWSFIALADAVSEGSTAAIDHKLLLMLRNSQDPTLMAGPPRLQEMMRDFTGLGGTGVLALVTMSAAGFLLLERKYHAALLLVVAVVGGMLLSGYLKAEFDRARPAFAPYGGSLAVSPSFPSGHSMMAAVVYLTIGALIARMRPDPRVRLYVLVLAVLVTILVGISRVYLGVHWPTDVLAGWALGAAWALLCWLGALLLQRRGKVERA